MFDQLVASGEGFLPVMDVRPVGRGLHLLLERFEDLLGVRRGDHTDKDSGGGTVCLCSGRLLGVEDVGEAGPAAQVEVSGGDVDGVEVLEGFAQGQPEPGVVGDVVEDVWHCWPLTVEVTGMGGWSRLSGGAPDARGLGWISG